MYARGLLIRFSSCRLSSGLCLSVMPDLILFYCQEGIHLLPSVLKLCQLKPRKTTTVNISQQVRSHMKENKIGFKVYKGKVTKPFTTVKNVKSYPVSTELHGKTLLVSEESLMNLGSVYTSEWFTLVHSMELTLCFKNVKASSPFQGAGAIDT